MKQIRSGYINVNDQIEEAIIGADADIYTNQGILLTEEEINTGQNHFSIAQGSKSRAFGAYSQAQGNNVLANGHFSHAEGQETVASSYSAHAEGYQTKALESQSHAEGEGAIAEGRSSHAEGENSLAKGEAAHSEGLGNQALGYTSHAEGYKTIASGNQAHSEGYHTQALGSDSHAEGYGENASIKTEDIIFSGRTDYLYGDRAWAIDTEKNYSTEELKLLSSLGVCQYNSLQAYRWIDKDFIVIFKNPNKDKSYVITFPDNNWVGEKPSERNHIEIKMTYEGYEINSPYGAFGSGSHSEGYKSAAKGNFSHSEGSKTNTYGESSHSEGRETKSFGLASHAEGHGTTDPTFDENFEISGLLIKEDGKLRMYKDTLTRKGDFYFDKDSFCITDEIKYCPIKKITDTTNYFEFELFSNMNSTNIDISKNIKILKIINGGIAFGDFSHIEGYLTTTKAQGSHAEGIGTIAIAEGQTVMGKYNKEDSEALLVIGNGNDNNNRSNILTVKNDGIHLFDRQKPILYYERYFSSQVLGENGLIETFYTLNNVEYLQGLNRKIATIKLIKGFQFFNYSMWKSFYGADSQIGITMMRKNEPYNFNNKYYGWIGSSPAATGGYSENHVFLTEITEDVEVDVYCWIQNIYVNGEPITKSDYNNNTNGYKNLMKGNNFGLGSFILS